MEKLQLKCPDCGSTQINLNTNTEEGFRYKCDGCGRKGNRKLFSMNTSTKDEHKKPDSGGDIWT